MFNRNNFIAAVMAAGAIFIPVFTLPGKVMAQDAGTYEEEVTVCFHVANRIGLVWETYRVDPSVSMSTLIEALNRATYDVVDFSEMIGSIQTIAAKMISGQLEPSDIVTAIKKECLISMSSGEPV